MTGKISDDENKAKLFDEDEQGAGGQIWVACVCLGLSLVCSGLWLVLLVSPK
ncbi:MAG: hypothetical protein KY445_16225 [Armatimonadetes bacterium]|nr:hypothetical protein [Armatimonadota bacterium]